MSRFGVLYIIYGEIVFSFLALLINTYYSKKLVNYGIVEQLKDISTIIIPGLVLAGIGMFLIDEIVNQFLQIIIVALFVMVIYLISIYYLNNKLFVDNLEIIKSKILKIK